MGSSLSCAIAFVCTGCSATNQFSPAQNWLSQFTGPSRNKAIDSQDSPRLAELNSTKRPISRSQQTSRQTAAPIVSANSIAPANQPTVATISFTAPSNEVPWSQVSESRPLAEQIPAQLAGLRRNPFGHSNNQSTCTVCQNQGCVGEGDCGTGGCSDCGQCEPERRKQDPQEYICDGGDLDPAVVVRKDWSAVGINTTDTVMYYETLDGKVCVTPSNRTCVYAPRFGAIRQVTGAMLADSALSPGRVHAPVPPLGLADLNRAGHVAQSTKIVGQKQVQLLDRFVDQQRGLLVDSTVPPTPVGGIVAAQVRADRALVDLALGREWVDLIEHRLEVITLINPEALQVEVGGQEAIVVSDAKSASEFILYETPDGCTLRLTKTASHQMASSGDRIRFTIRFENTGTQKLGNPVILDSLSPRLNYIEGSQQCSVEARFSMEPNETGSSVLRWDIVSPIESQRGGVISFDCEVR